MTLKGLLNLSELVFLICEVGMQSVAGQKADISAVSGKEGEVASSLSPETLEQKLDSPLVEQGLPLPANSDNHYGPNRRLPLG